VKTEICKRFLFKKITIEATLKNKKYWHLILLYMGHLSSKLPSLFSPVKIFKKKIVDKIDF